METASNAQGFKDKIEEIQYLGQMLSASTIEDTTRLEVIVQRLSEIVLTNGKELEASRKEATSEYSGCEPIGTVEPIYEQADMSKAFDITAFLRGFVEKYRSSELRAKDIIHYLDDLLGNKIIREVPEPPTYSGVGGSTSRP